MSFLAWSTYREVVLVSHIMLLTSVIVGVSISLEPPRCLDIGHRLSTIYFDVVYNSVQLCALNAVMEFKENVRLMNCFIGFLIKSAFHMIFKHSTMS